MKGKGKETAKIYLLIKSTDQAWLRDHDRRLSFTGSSV